jgi:hypothetical protein
LCLYSSPQDIPLCINREVGSQGVYHLPIFKFRFKIRR